MEVLIKNFITQILQSLCNFISNLASRFMFQTIDMKTAIDEVSLLESLREIAEKHSDLNITFFNLFFPFFDQYALVKPSLLKNYLIASVCIIFVTFILIPDILVTIFLVFAITRDVHTALHI